MKSEGNTKVALVFAGYAVLGGILLIAAGFAFHKVSGSRLLSEKAVDEVQKVGSSRPRSAETVYLGGDVNAVLTMTIEEKINDAGVIVLASHKAKEGQEGKHYLVISEILKHDPSVDFNFRVGDVLRSPLATDGADVGEAAIVYCTGSPAQPVYWVSVHDGVFKDYNGVTMELEQFKELLADQVAHGAGGS